MRLTPPRIWRGRALNYRLEGYRCYCGGVHLRERGIICPNERLFGRKAEIDDEDDNLVKVMIEKTSPPKHGTNGFNGTNGNGRGQDSGKRQSEQEKIVVGDGSGS